MFGILSKEDLEVVLNGVGMVLLGVNGLVYFEVFLRCEKVLKI